MAATISDVAKLAGVSTATVSSVLNRRANIKPSTRLKVLEAIEALGYAPSQAARDLVRQDQKRFGNRKTGNLGIIYFKAYHAESFSDNPFYYAVFEGISAEAEAKNCGLLFASIESMTDRLSIPKMIRERQVDGLILIGNVERNATVIHTIRKQFPVVLVSRHIPGEDIEGVVADNAGGARKAIRHLVESGYEEVGFLTPPLGNTCYSERLSGYRSALEEFGLPFRQDLVAIGDDNDSWIGEYVQRIRSRSSSKPVGIFAANDVVAIKVIGAARDAGIEVPREIGVIGFDDLPVSVQISPSLTTMRVPKATMGRVAVKRLLEMAVGKGHAPGRFVLPVELVQRESCRREPTRSDGQASLDGKGVDATQGARSAPGRE